MKIISEIGIQIAPRRNISDVIIFTLRFNSAFQTTHKF